MPGDIFGNGICMTLAGESHGRAVNVILSGVPSGIEVDEETIAAYLRKRMGIPAISTPRREKDDFEILSGVYNGHTTGTPIAVLIPNEDMKSADYDRLRGIARPGHGDYTNSVRFGGFEDPRGGGHTSGRITAGIVAAGGILIPALERKGIKIGCHILSVGDIRDRDFEDTDSDIALLHGSDVAVLDPAAKEKMIETIRDTASARDSIGGVLECVMTGLPAGIGDPLFDSVESVISHAVFSIPGVKGIEFGGGFELSRMKGSSANDSFSVRGGKIVTETNNCGGILGGITDGMPVTFRVAVKPTPSIGLPQKTVDYNKMEETEITVEGRHDACIASRIPVIVESAAAAAISDLLERINGEGWLAE